MRGGSFLPLAIFALVRWSWAFTRAVPELVWALLAVFIFSPGIVPGAIALAIHNYGVLSKLAAEVVEGMDMRPIEALRSSGAGRNKTLLYGVLPQVLPRFMTYLLYRWEVVMRTTIVVGFVAAGGLGMEFRLAMSSFHYTTVSLLLMWYLLLVLGVDAASAGLRKLAR
jgi:phosphonate transport system permease protein